MFGAMPSTEMSQGSSGRVDRVARGALALIAMTILAAMFWAPLSSADTTIGAYVQQNPSTSGSCGYKAASEQPCLFVDTIIPGLAATAPCDGTVTRFRLNGIPKPNNHYRLRVVRRNADESFTGTASSAPVTLAVDGVNEYVTSLPIATGEYIGVDFQNPTEQFGLRWVEQPASGALYFYGFPADGGSARGTGSSTISYLYNADIFCTPSNAFKVIKLKGTALTVELSSAGAVAITGAETKGKPKLLKPTQAAGGPGRINVNLKLTAAAKKVMQEKGKVRVKTVVTFMPTGGSPKALLRTFTVKKPKASK
jgi:hypothetical protein